MRGFFCSILFCDSNKCGATFVHRQNTMEITTLIIQLAGFVVAGTLVFFTTYYLVKKLTENQRNLMLLDIKGKQADLVTPSKLQAYERLVIFLTRISPDNLIVRHSRSGQSSQELREVMISTINEEFNHNISQQIYISDQAWNAVKYAKEEIISIIDEMYKHNGPDISGPELGKLILERLIHERNHTTQKAISILKKELQIAL